MSDHQINVKLLNSILLRENSRASRGALQPECVSPVIAAFASSWNDALASDADRDRLLKDLIPLMIGTRTTPADDETRALMSMDWIVREFAPAWLDLVPALSTHAATLRAIPPVKSCQDLDAVLPAIVDAQKASAAGSAAWDAARAARDAAWDAARDARDARDAAGSAAWDAARAALKPTTAKLQESARDLIRHMCAVGH